MSTFNTVGLVTVLVVVTAFVIATAVVAEEGPGDDLYVIVPLLAVIYLAFGYALIWTLRTRHWWHDTIIITREGIGRRNPANEEVFTRWCETRKPKRNLLRDELHIYSKDGERLLRIDVALARFDLVLELVTAMSPDV